MFRREGARSKEIWRYLFPMSALLLAAGLFANTVFAGVGISLPASKAEALTTLIKPLALEGGTDVCVSCPDGTYPHITQFQSMVWGHANTVVVAYDDSRGSSNCYAAYSYSTDGGATFTRPGGTGPSPICTGHGLNYGIPNVLYNERLSMWFLANLATGCGGGGIGLWTSADGITFTPGPCVHNINEGDDNVSLWVDNMPTSPYYGRMYLSFNEGPYGSRIKATYSDDGATWTTPVVAIPIGYNYIRTMQNVVGQDGTVFIFALDEHGGGIPRLPRTNILARSTDGGASWRVSIMGPDFQAPGVATSGYMTLMFPRTWRYMGWGQPAVGPNHTAHYVYTQHGPGNDPADVVYVRSTDNGLTWSTPMQLNTDTSGQRNWGGSLAATADGTLVASWYDGREITTDCALGGVDMPCYRRWGRISRDNGATWEPDFTIGDTISPLPLQPDPNLQNTNQGHFDHATANGNTIYTTWNDGRTFISGNSQPDVYFDKVVIPTFTPTSTPQCAPNCTITPTFTRTRTSTATPTICGTYIPGPAVSATIVPGTTDIGNHTGDGVTTITLPFPVRFYNNQSYTSANVSSNGNLQFITSSIIWLNTCLPEPAWMGPSIMPLWGNLSTETFGNCSPGPCGIYTSVSGAEPNRIFNIEWRAFFFSDGGSANFEIRLYENSPDFDIILGEIRPELNTETIGVQDGNSRYVQIACRTDITPYLNKRIPMTLVGCGLPTTPTPTPCGQCNLGILTVTSSCNVDGTTHWIAIPHNPDPCTISAPWRAELQVRENGGNWRAVRIQYATTSFPHGDTVLDGTFCYRFSQNTQVVRVEYLFEDQEHISQGSNGNVQDREAVPNSHTSTLGNSNPVSRSGKSTPRVCDADMASPAMIPCTRIDSCN